MAAEASKLERGAPRVAVDLDAARAARREAHKEPPIVVMGEEVFTLPLECPFTLIEDLEAISEAEKVLDGGAAAAATRRIVTALLGDRYDAFMKHGPTMDDLQEMITGILPAYGFQENARGN